MEDMYKVYLHTPPHYFVPNAMYMVTGSIVHKQNLLFENNHKELFLKVLFEKTNSFGWNLEAWAVLHNHYHFIAQAPEDSKTLAKLIQQVHSITAIQFNRWNNSPGRQVWQNYWDTCITHEKSYLARLRYVHENPVKHGLVADAIDYPYCSYRWFIEQGDVGLKEQVINQPIDKVNVFVTFNLDGVASLLAPLREQAPDSRILDSQLAGVTTGASSLSPNLDPSALFHYGSDLVFEFTRFLFQLRQLS